GFVSSSYNYNFNKPASQTNCGVAPLQFCVRIFDQDANSFKLDNTELVFLKEAEDTGDIGFRFDLTFGFSLPEGAQRARSSATQPAPAGLATDDDDFDLQQAYVTWKAPVGKGLQLDLGKFVTHVGAEVFSGYDGWNMNFSRTYVFGWGIPFNHTGLRATYQVSDLITVMGMVANNWEEDGVSDNNTDKTFGGQIAISPSDTIGVLINWVGGNQGSGQTAPISTNNNWRNIFDIVVDIALTNQWSLQLNADYGAEENANTATGGTAKWGGFAGIIRYDVNKWFSMNVRGAHFIDEDGFRLGAANNRLWEVTVTPEFRVMENMVIRFEYRHDGSNLNIFEDQNGLGKDSQDTVAMNALIHF
ncbi:MAG: outer membrane beta-barrel protein, partial [Nitrospinaceae bacterium]|nr:porin [Nitrospinaceae bacterium]NIR55672.1 porin [Nitrospinaceae bacterium]NIS86116.1 porin [Nitrospinaceae bacterium]NIT82960.1 porin [Nitrospinaceae bacterium]NIU45163.1 porin [Nitrospinaceae bacterium]